MQTKKPILITFFIGILLISLLSFFFQDLSGSISESENRFLAELPVFSLETRLTYPQEFEAFVDDHFPFREQLLRIHAFLEYSLFRSFADGNILIGKDDWFFYDPKDPEEANAVRDIKGIGLPTDRELDGMIHDLEAFRDRLRNEGIDFMILVTPNKTNLYREYLPESIEPFISESRLERTLTYIRERRDLDIFDASVPLLEAKHQGQAVYYRHDDHWNQLGAWITANAFSEKYFDRPLKKPDFSLVPYRGGELAKWSHLDGILEEKNYYQIDPADLPEFEIVRDLGKWTTRDYIPKNGGEKHLFVIGDSFGDIFFSYLADEYSKISFRRFDFEYGYNDIIETQPDIVMLELTERFFTPEIVNTTLDKGL